MWKLSIEDDQGATTVVQLVRSEYTLGRGEENTIRLTERNISRRHARLTKQGASWFLFDCGSYNGCFVNGVRAGESHPVGPRDLIQLGDYRLEFITDESTVQDAGEARNDTLNSNIPSPLLASSKDRLVMVVGPTPGREYILSQGRQSLGRGENCDITVNHASVSRVHAEIHYIKDNCYEIIDKRSSNGLRINGVELKQGIIEARDVVEFGDVVLKFIPSGQLYRPTPEETKKLAALLGVGDTSGSLDHSTRFRLAWSSMSPSVRWGVSVLGVLVLVMFGAVITTGRTTRHSAVVQIGSAVPIDPNQKLLKAAQDFVTAGNLEAAHAQLLGISESSPLRSGAAFSEIESKWADSLFERAAKATTNEEKRAVLDTLVNERNLDETRHAKAKDALSSLRDNVVAVDELPKTEPSKVANQAPSNPITTNTPTPDSNPTAVSRATSSVAPGSNVRPIAATKPAPVATPAPAVDTSANSELVQARAKRNALKARVAAGTATEQEKRLLRSICRQLNDSTCSR
jgi:pSer/pThr/pTyr-binding forkhead associated (FHA) protein